MRMSTELGVGGIIVMITTMIIGIVTDNPDIMNVGFVSCMMLITGSGVSRSIEDSCGLYGGKCHDR